MNKIYLLLLCLVLYTNTVNSEELVLWSQSAILIDYETEQILFQKNKNQAIQPASMTKLITIFMAYRAIESGQIKKNDLVPISNNADYKNLPRDSSLMFIEKGQKVTLLELMIGLAIPSGNDAAIAIAEYLYGTVESYLIEVNKLMKKMGLTDLKFVDSSGYSDDNSITPAQFAEFCTIFIKKYPESLEELFSLESFTYPKIENGSSTLGGITQFNHNPIIKVYPQCDGLKTGFINASGMNISLTAKNDKRRVVAVLTGVKDEKLGDAELKRIHDSLILLNHGLTDFKNIRLDKIVLPEIKVLNSTTKSIKPIIPYKSNFLLYNNIEPTYKIKSIKPPIEYGETLGFVYFTQGDIDYKFPIISNKEIYNLN